MILKFYFVTVIALLKFMLIFSVFDYLFDDLSIYLMFFIHFKQEDIMSFITLSIIDT
ncbi:hypothetical protein G8T60_04655 [Clostridium botulinum C]|uniref:Uncharacterized protein n=1 Tax=Clostridium botulinum C TaxID=36828 RepID=A0A9Q3VAE1_CLOBO|nr:MULTISPECIES: hypothetical protein [Clostridium]MCD3195246.1 hypothetical protein [Clostridium botulinum C]MCD3207086.1 hypothetical protein [Clostridium botulinum C]MCD3208436.1 hypothetical protein [Clostridium botulinum C]MCD3226456.1 hypothetical protein [Clostridium botulinum C]MCD3256023.1 hypothetical protein [Clostridium botulinum C]